MQLDGGTVFGEMKCLWNRGGPPGGARDLAARDPAAPGGPSHLIAGPPPHGSWAAAGCPGCAHGGPPPTFCQVRTYNSI